ncbi:uncharacterized protein LOC143032481 isoform X3 [Oratosquilla oratoria]|uniref:uncharacterized protein LOC143032481 isoform X3 n=1 Tax=Oratosquilla oratoria TaxID=337810 RepID=UPI003F77139D
MEDQLFVVPQDGEITLMDTDNGEIVVEQGPYSFTIPSTGQQQVLQAQGAQQVVYAPQQFISPGSPPPVIQDYRLVTAPQQQQQILATSLQNKPPQQVVAQQVVHPMQVLQQQISQPQQFVSSPGPNLVRQVPEQKQRQLQLQLQQQQQQQQQRQVQLIQLQQQQKLQMQQQVPQAPQQQQPLRPPQVHNTPQQIRMILPPQLNQSLQQHQQQQQHPQQLAVIQQKIMNDDGTVQVVRTPLSHAGISRLQKPQQQQPQHSQQQQLPQQQAPQQAQQQVQVHQQQLQQTPQPTQQHQGLHKPQQQQTNLQLMVQQQPQPSQQQQHSQPSQQQHSLSSSQQHQQQPQPQQQQQQQQQQPHQAQQSMSRPEYHLNLKQLEQKSKQGNAITKTCNKHFSYQRRLISQKLKGGNSPGSTSASDIIRPPSGEPVTPNSSTQSQNIPAHVPGSVVKPVLQSPNKKLTLEEYRQRNSSEKNSPQKPIGSGTLQPVKSGEEVRIPGTGTNSQIRQQFYCIQKTDGTRVLAVMPVTPSSSATSSGTGGTMVNNVSSSSSSIVKTSRVRKVSEKKINFPQGSGDYYVIYNERVKFTASKTSPVQHQVMTVQHEEQPSTAPSASPPIQEATVRSTTGSPDHEEKDMEDKPRCIPGQMAVCTYCGILSEDFNRCQRCKKQLPSNVRTMEASGTQSSSKPTQSVSHISTSQISKQRKPQGVAGMEKKLNQLVKGRGRGRGRGKQYEEPVILILSSDEEEAEEKSSPIPGSAPTVDPQIGLSQETLSQKEPVITADMENYQDAEDTKGAVRGGGLPDIESLSDGNLKGPYTSFPCRSIRVGSYKVMPNDRVLFVPQGIRLVIPPFDQGEDNVVLNIPIKSIIKILVNFGRSLPVFFLYIKPSTAANVRRLLKMTNEAGYYYDPCSQDETHKRITILPERMTEDTKSIVKQLYGGAARELVHGPPPGSKCILEELDLREANEILVRSSPSEVQCVMKKNQGTPISEVKLLLIYPPPPQKEGISISPDDYCCLEEEQFLNDVIIDFYLKWLLQSKLSEIHRQKTHVLSSFFYKRLTAKPKKGRRPHAIEDDPKLSAAEKRHSRVKSWTKNVDIFEKDFIIIPINEHAHWFLAIVCFPGLNGAIRISDGMPVDTPACAQKPQRRRSNRPKTKVEIPVIDDGEWSDRDEAEGDEDELEDDDEDEEPPSKKSKSTGNAQAEGETETPEPPPTPAIRQPCILIFDSLAGANRARIVATVRDYLTVEHRVRKGTEKVFNRDTMKGACPKVPQQMNYSDCGIFTLQFAESFFEQPIKDYSFPIRSLHNWFPQEVVSSKREAIAKLIRRLMNEHNPNHNIILPEIFFNSAEERRVVKPSGPPTSQTSTSPTSSVTLTTNTTTTTTATTTTTTTTTTAMAIETSALLSRAEASVTLPSSGPQSLGTTTTRPLTSPPAGPSGAQDQMARLGASPPKTEVKLPQQSSFSSTSTINTSCNAVASQETKLIAAPSTLVPQKVIFQNSKSTSAVQNSASELTKVVNKAVPSTLNRGLTVDSKGLPEKSDRRPVLAPGQTEVKVTNHGSSHGLSLLQEYYGECESMAQEDYAKDNSELPDAQASSNSCESNLCIGDEAIVSKQIPIVGCVSPVGGSGGSKRLIIGGENPLDIRDKKVQSSGQVTMGVINTKNTGVMMPGPGVHRLPAPSTVPSVIPRPGTLGKPVRQPIRIPLPCGRDWGQDSQNNVNQENITSHPPVQSRIMKEQSQVKAVNNLSQTEIIDGDTNEVLLIMPRQAPSPSKQVVSKPNNSPPKVYKTVEVSGTNSQNLTEVSPLKSNSSLAKPSVVKSGVLSTETSHTSALQRNLVNVGKEDDNDRPTVLSSSSSSNNSNSNSNSSSSTSSSHSFSSSHHHPGCSRGSSHNNYAHTHQNIAKTGGGNNTPSVFKFSERGTSSGRTIAPPKRYLDAEGGAVPRKRREKNQMMKPKTFSR